MSPLHCRCVEPCNSNCLNGTCYHNKTCRLGCKTGYWGSSCQQSCSTTCNNTLDNSTSSCDVSGHCVLGCKKTYMGAQCERRCNEACFDGDCHQDSGICVKGCIKGYYGQICNQTCNSNCYKTDCYHSNGTCKMCLAGFHGFFCAKRCPENCLNKVCSQDDGVCLKGCVKGMSGPQCDTGKYFFLINQEESVHFQRKQLCHFQFCFHSHLGSTLQGNNLLLQEQILSLKSRPAIGRASSS